MAQFTVYQNPNPTSKKTYPYLLDIQTNLLEDLRTTVVIPLSPIALVGNAVISKLCPIIEIENNHFIALSQQIAGIDRKALGKKICDVSQFRAEIIAALDFLISGI